MASKTLEDPTGQRVNRARTERKFNKRINAAQRDVISLFRNIPKRRRIVPNLAVYDYDVTPEQTEAFNAEIRRIIDLWLLNGAIESVPNNWWYKQEIEQPVRQGMLEEINEFNRLIGIAITAGIVGAGGMLPQRIAPELIFSSPEYLSTLRNVYVENFQTIKTLSSRTAGQVIQRINTGIQSGLTPSQITKEIRERFSVSKSGAKRITDTEVNKAYNDAKLRATQQVARATGLAARVRHISALLPTTREKHAARHKKTYTVEAQRIWWDTGANRINCHCSTTTVLVNRSGEVIEG